MRKRQIGLYNLTAVGYKIKIVLRVLVDITLIGKEDGESVLRLPRDKNNLSVNYSNPQYIAPEYQYIEYRLDGYDSEWKKKIGKSPILYYDLSPGTYMLRVRRGDGRPGESALKITVVYGFFVFIILSRCFRSR